MWPGMQKLKLSSIGLDWSCSLTAQVCADGSVQQIAPQSADANFCLPRLPIADDVYTADSAQRVQKWRAQKCDPSVRGFDAAARVPATPRMRRTTSDAREAAATLEVTVFPDAMVQEAKGWRQMSALPDANVRHPRHVSSLQTQALYCAHGLAWYMERWLDLCTLQPPNHPCFKQNEDFPILTTRLRCHCAACEHRHRGASQRSLPRIS